MQDQNNENTRPNRVDSSDATQNMNVGETRPLRAQMPAAAPVDLPVASQSDITETQPTNIPPAQPVQSRRWPWFLLGFAIIFLFGGIGSYIGYRNAIELRKASHAEQVVTRATEHFMLGLEAQKNGQYAVARQQFEYVIASDPKFPGAAEKLTEVMIAMASTATPTTAPSPTVIPITPTPDLRGHEEMFSTARQQYAAQDWDNFMMSVDALRGLDPKYRSIDVDGMLYVAYRFRGMRKIYQEANLEGGIYDLALAERYAPLDADANGARNWARLYLNGVSFWGADWARVVTIFEQIYPYFPNLRDATGLTATERYRQAAVEQGKILLGRGDGCGALEYFDKALAVAPDSGVEQRAAEAYQVCYPPTETPAPTETPTLTVPVIETTDPAPVETTPAPVVEVTETPTPGSNP